jgi:uncharacterized protein
MDPARAIEVLKQLRPRLEARGVVHAGIFGSVGRDRASAASDVDVVVTPDAKRRLDLVDFGGIQTLLEEAFAGLDVDVVVEPIRRADLQIAVERDRIDAF